jgi:hypothetical protein
VQARARKSEISFVYLPKNTAKENVKRATSCGIFFEAWEEARRRKKAEP